ncbi:MAG TPA: hypothetical protein VMV48_04020 [Gallionellaceae bacterium]|nr:hypothetical protein [Gallionellaceae bacterium]
MDVSSVTSSSIMQPGLFAMASVQPVTSLFNISATTGTSSVDIVDISGLGQLLSVSSIFETAILKAAATNKATFFTVVAATQYFVDAFNSFMQSDSMQNSLDGSLGNLFIQVLNTQTTASSGNSKSIIASLSEVGVNLQAATSQNGAGLMTIDFKTLQSAFNADQLGTISLLAQSIQSIGQLAAEFTSLFTQSNNLTQSSQSSPNAAIFNALLAATASTETTARTTAPIATATTTTAPAEVEAAVTTVTAAGAAAAAAATMAAAAATTTTIAPAEVAESVTTVTAAGAAAATAATMAAAAATTTTTAPATATTTALAPATLSATEPVATPELIATPTATVLPTTTTLPTTLVTVAAAPTTVATPQNFINPIIDASNPAVAAAIAAYHVADRIFDSSKHYEVLPTSFPGYSEIRPVAPIQPVRLDLYA